jgi:hypothetical protein
VRRIKATNSIPLIPTFSLKGEGAGTYIDTCLYGCRNHYRGSFKNSAFKTTCSHPQPLINPDLKK